MNKTKENTLCAIFEQGLLPLYFEADQELSWEILKSLYASGVRVVEYTNRGKEAAANFKYLKSMSASAMPDLYLGIGTIRNIDELQIYISLDADFFVSPIVDLSIGKKVHDLGKLWIPGCFSPTEVNLAYQEKAGLIKLFPANLLGPEYLTSIKDIFPGQHFMPTGGVDLTEENISAWYAAGVSAVGMGSKLIAKDLIKNRDFNQIQERCTSLIKTIQKIKQVYK